MADGGFVCVSSRLLRIGLSCFLLVCSSVGDLVSHTQVLEPRQLFVYSSYKDIQIFHYLVPQQVLLSTLSFIAIESGGCTPKQVMLYLQHGSYPVVSPDNATYPDRFYLRRTSLLELSMYSDATPNILNVSTPEPGDWFVAAFLPEKSDRIEQKGLAPVCRTLLSSTINFTLEHNVVHLLPGVSMPQRTESPQYYKFYVSENTWSARIMVKNCATVPAINELECPVLLYARSSVLYAPAGVAEHFTNCSESYKLGQCVLDFIPRENSWHYVYLDIEYEPKVEYRIIVETSVCENGYSPSQYLVLSEFKLVNNSMPVNKDSLLSGPNSFKRVFMPLPFNARTKAPTPTCWPRVPLLRKTYPGNFIFNFEQLPNRNGTTPTKLDISNAIPTLLIAPVQPVLDIGGTIAFELSLDFSVNTSTHNVSVVACIQKDMRALVYGPHNCTSPLSLVVNTSSISAMGEYVMVPFPEPGNWYVTLAVYCYNESSDGRSEGSDDRNVDLVSCDTNTTTVTLNIISSSCIYGTCGPYGRCYQYISGGFIFSTCVCTAGWAGWGCTDNSHAIPDFDLLLSTLLLTLSNLLFIPSVILAVYRRLYTEALVFFLTMFFSTFYHACDEEAYTFCLMRLSVMQFCDFYLAIMSVWVTLVAMSDLHPKLYSLLHMAGAIGVALGVEYDRTGLWVFVVPSIVGLAVLMISWILHCNRQKSCFPERKVWLLCLLPGVLLAGTGMACFALFETEDNYKYVHSSWHATMALSILFLLPSSQKHKENAQSLLDVTKTPEESLMFLEENVPDVP